MCSARPVSKRTSIRRVGSLLRMRGNYVAECAVSSIEPPMSMPENAKIYEWLMSSIRQLWLPDRASSRAPDAEDASGTATLRVSFRHAAAPAPDAQAGPP